MRCILCEKLSFSAICKPCAARLLGEEKRTRILEGGMRVYSFFAYSSVAPILLTKHRFWGHRALKQIADMTFGEFAKNFSFPDKIACVAIDDHADNGYSHTAILSRALKSAAITPLYGALRARSKVKYSGQSYDFRRAHPRNFEVKIKNYKDVILVDDVITSGLTLKEASESLKKHGINTLFALTLADARD